MKNENEAFFYDGLHFPFAEKIRTFLCRSPSRPNSNYTRSIALLQDVELINLFFFLFVYRDLDYRLLVDSSIIVT